MSNVCFQECALLREAVNNSLVGSACENDLC